MNYLKTLVTCALFLAALAFPVAEVMAADDYIVILYNDGTSQRIRVRLDEPPRSIRQIEFPEGRMVFVYDNRGTYHGGGGGWRDDHSNHREEALIKVISATYGKNCGARQGNATNHLAGICNGKTTCEYGIDYRILGDPASGCGKDYVAEWECGRDHRKRTLRIPPEAGDRTRIELKCQPGR